MVWGQICPHCKFSFPATAATADIQTPAPQKQMLTLTLTEGLETKK